VWCSVLQCVAVCCSMLPGRSTHSDSLQQCIGMARCVRGRDIHANAGVGIQHVVVLQSLAHLPKCHVLRFRLFCSVLQCFAVFCSVLQCVAVCGSVWQCVAVCSNSSPSPFVSTALQCVAVSCSELQSVAVCCIAVCSNSTLFPVVSFASPTAQTLIHPPLPCNTLQHTATHCNILQHTATSCNTMLRRQSILLSLFRRELGQL